MPKHTNRLRFKFLPHYPQNTQNTDNPRICIRRHATAPSISRAIELSIPRINSRKVTGQQRCEFEPGWVFVTSRISQRQPTRSHPRPHRRRRRQHGGSNFCMVVRARARAHQKQNLLFPREICPFRCTGAHGWTFGWWARKSESDRHVSTDAVHSHWVGGCVCVCARVVCDV